MCVCVCIYYRGYPALYEGGSPRVIVTNMLA